MRHKLAVMVYLCLSSTALAQTPAPVKVSDAYAKAALLAMKAIRSDGSTPEIRNGQEFANRKTLEAIDSADVEATTDPEKAVTKTLSKLYSDKLTNNLNRKIIALRLSTALMDARKPHDDLAISEAMSKEPEFLEMSKRETACFVALDSSLRARSAAAPAECSSIAIELK